MARGLSAGGTDYSHQSFSDLANDLRALLKLLSTSNNLLLTTRQKLIQHNYWEKILIDFRLLIDRFIHFFSTCIEEITNIEQDVQIEVRPDHITRLNSLGDTAHKLQVRIGKIWNSEDVYIGDHGFEDVELLYREGRQMALDLLDLSNISSRLKDFVGKRSIIESNLSQDYSLIGV